MDSCGAIAIFDEEWQSFMTKMFCTEQDSSDLVLNFQDQVGTGLSFDLPSNFLSTVDAAGVDDHAAFFSSDSLDTPNFYQVSQESGHSNISQENGVDFLDCVINDTFHHNVQSTHFSMMDYENDIKQLRVSAYFRDEDHVMENILLPKEDGGNISQIKRKPEFSQEQMDECLSSDNPKKKFKAGVSNDIASSNEPRIISQRKKNKKVKQISMTTELEEETNGEGNGRSSSSCSSVSRELINGGGNSKSKSSSTVNSNGKARAGRGSATDPQSLYARRRRERINERLRILQNLVPNGTKVDISTMLEEAVHYVKFLQLQIKLLSSDDLWMYAPIAYNGMDIGLYQKISHLAPPCY